MSYIGSSATPLPVNFSAVQSQGFNGTGSQTTFTLNRSVGSAASIEVLVNNVQQSPYDGSYSVSGTTLTFSEAPSAGTNNVYVVYRDQSLGSLVDTTAYRKAEVDSAVAGKVNKAGDTISGDLEVDGVLFIDGGSGGPSVTLRNGGDLRLQSANNANSVHVYCDEANKLTVSGRLQPTTGTSQSCSNAAAITVNTSTPTVIASASITTNGYPVLLAASGDQNPNQPNGWHYVQFAVDNIAIGKLIINENAGGTSKNCPFALTHIHHPPAGTYTFQVRAWQGSGSMTYGEAGDGQAPTITAVELR